MPVYLAPSRRGETTLSFSKIAKCVGWTSFALGAFLAILSVNSPLAQIIDQVEQIGAVSFFFTAAFFAMQTLVKKIEGGHTDIIPIAGIIKELSGPLLSLIFGLTITTMSIWLSLSR